MQLSVDANAKQWRTQPENRGRANLNYKTLAKNDNIHIRLLKTSYICFFFFFLPSLPLAHILINTLIYYSFTSTFFENNLQSLTGYIAIQVGCNPGIQFSCERQQSEHDSIHAPIWTTFLLTVDSTSTITNKYVGDWEQMKDDAPFLEGPHTDTRAEGWGLRVRGVGKRERVSERAAAGCGVLPVRLHYSHRQLGI